MSGAGYFRSDGHRSAAEEHLGDRLAAFVDGELGAETRERVAVHLATCEQCKAEADEQRRLKSAVAGALPPALSAGLLARLQKLAEDDREEPPGPAGHTTHSFGRDPFTGFGGLGGLGAKAGAESPAAPGGPSGGFRIHEVGRPGSRGRRLAFAAAGAFSMAAIALGSALPFDAAVESGTAVDPGTGAAVTPLFAGGTGTRVPDLLTEPVNGMIPLLARQPLLARHGDRPGPVDDDPSSAAALPWSLPTVLAPSSKLSGAPGVVPAAVPFPGTASAVGPATVDPAASEPPHAGP